MKSKPIAGWVLAGLAGSLLSLQAGDWPEWRGEGRRGIWDDEGLLKSFAGPVLEPVWSAPVGAGYNGPTVAGEGVYVMDRITLEGREVERILRFDRQTGKQVWAHSYPCVYRDVSYPLGPRASVTIADGKTYSLGTMGHFFCLNSESGAVEWSLDFGEKYQSRIPIWGITCSPLVERDVVVVQVGGSDGACVVGLNRHTGKEIWRAFDDRASYVSPIMIEQAGQRVLVVWTGGRIAGMEAASGKVHWQIELKPRKMPINVPGPALNRERTRMFLSTFYDGSRLLEIAQDRLDANLLWERQGINERKTEALHNMISPPYIEGDYIYGVDSYGQLRCLDLKTGDRVWESIDEAVPTGRWSTIFMVRGEEKTWMFNELGELILARLSPQGFEEMARTKIIEPTTPLRQRGRNIVWSHPAFAHGHIFARSDRELVCVSLREPGS